MPVASSLCLHKQHRTDMTAFFFCSFPEPGRLSRLLQQRQSANSYLSVLPKRSARATGAVRKAKADSRSHAAIRAESGTRRSARPASSRDDLPGGGRGGRQGFTWSASHRENSGCCCERTAPRGAAGTRSYSDLCGGNVTAQEGYRASL